MSLLQQTLLTKGRPRCESCTLCELGEQKNIHTHCLWGAGRRTAPIVLIGEAPGWQEDQRHEPFVGEAGKLLDHVITKLGLTRDLFYITNCIRCRPPTNKLPASKALNVCWSMCSMYMRYELDTLVAPKVIVLLGATALKLLAGKQPVSKYEGTWVAPQTLAAYHPAYILRSPSREARLAAAIALAARTIGVKVGWGKGWDHGMFPYEVRL